MKIGRCEDEKMACVDVKIGRCEDEKMICEDVKMEYDMCRCVDKKMRR